MTSSAELMPERKQSGYGLSQLFRPGSIGGRKNTKRDTSPGDRFCYYERISYASIFRLSKNREGEFREVDPGLVLGIFTMNYLYFIALVVYKLTQEHLLFRDLTGAETKTF